MQCLVASSTLQRAVKTELQFSENLKVCQFNINTRPTDPFITDSCVKMTMCCGQCINIAVQFTAGVWRSTCLENIAEASAVVWSDNDRRQNSKDLKGMVGVWLHERIQEVVVSIKCIVAGLSWN